LKLPSPFTLTVRASTDYVKVFPEQLPESERLAGLVRSANVGFVLTPERSCTWEQGVAPTSASGKAAWPEWDRLRSNVLRRCTAVRI